MSTEKVMPPSAPPVTTMVAETKKKKAAVNPPSTNPVVVPSPERPGPSEDGWFVGVLHFCKKFLWGFYLGLLLLGLLALLLRKRLVAQNEKRKAAGEQ